MIKSGATGRNEKLTGAGEERNGAVSGLNWPLKFCSMVMLLNLRDAVQSAKSICPRAF